MRRWLLDVTQRPVAVVEVPGLDAAPIRMSSAMLPTDHLPEFLLTVYVLILIPGPSVLFVVSRGVALGRRAAFATAVGNESGFALQLCWCRSGWARWWRARTRCSRR